MKDFVFSDGIVIPKGTLIGVAIRPVHHEEKFYENANVFQPFRFFEMHEENREGAKGQLVSTAIDYLPWGHGKHAWYDAFLRAIKYLIVASPGRFFATNELKSMLAHIVVTYDVKLEDNMERPRSWRFGTSIIADPHAKVLFRKRVD